jgi:predicted transcriptional regulator
MAYVSEISSAYLANNQIDAENIQLVLKRIFQSVLEISRDVGNVKHGPALTPAVPIENSVHDNYIVCLEDGKKLQMLKRHLNTVYNMTIEQYRQRWGLPLDYPVVSPDYAKRRSQIAKTTGLGNSERRRDGNREKAA